MHRQFVLARGATMLIWTEQFATGFPKIDEQHRQLIRHVNQLEVIGTL
jgi:hemerythrin